MSWILVTNDDGVDSPALGPFAHALRELGDVRIVVPEGERSWIGKAITRYGEVGVKEVDRFGVPTLAVAGFPADAVQIGAVAFDEPPSMVVSGINLGYNHGAGYLISSGTVGAAIEGWEIGVPAYSFSAGSEGVWAEWHRYAWSEASIPEWRRLSGVCADVLARLVDEDMPGDVINVNLPWDSTSETPVRVTTIAKVAYGQLHRPTGNGSFQHTYNEDFIVHEPLEGTDVGVSHDGAIAITPMSMPTAPAVSPDIRARLERG